VREEITRTGALGEKDFDELFGDDFFRRRLDPFEEIDRVRTRLENDFAGTERDAFRTSFDGWFSKRIGLDGITTKIADRGKDVAVTFGIPGLDEDSVKFDVNADRIRMSYATRKDVKKNGSDVETSTSVEKILPLPAGADPAGFEVQKGKDEITLVFHKFEHAA
jgi:HSP20 family molecular chaperone IbpA